MLKQLIVAKSYALPMIKSRIIDCNYSNPNVENSITRYQVSAKYEQFLRTHRKIQVVQIETSPVWKRCDVFLARGCKQFYRTPPFPSRLCSSCGACKIRWKTHVCPENPAALGARRGNWKKANEKKSRMAATALSDY